MIPLRRSLTGFFAYSFVLAAGAAVMAAGCSVATTTSAMGAGDNAYAQPTEDTDGGYESDGETRADDAATPETQYRGSPLCYANLDATTCFPDDAPLVGQCKAPRAPSADAGASPADGGNVVPGVACHVVSDPTAAGSSTAPAGTPTCLVAGTGHDGDQCLKPTDCATGFECVGSPGQCRHYCCDGTCDGKAQFCDIQTVADVGSLPVPVCAPVRSCKLLSQMGCATGETCAIVNDDDGTTSCVATGPSQVGMACEKTHCAESLTCLGQPGSRRCYQLCDKTANSGCTAPETCKGNAPLFRDANIGVCQK
jgi:hypothetical protein